jgi:hypothetical protein
VIAPATVRLPIHFFGFSVLWLACGSVLLPSVAPEAIRFHYQPSVLSLVHVFTLGFITSVIMGVMYRYVPALTRRPVACPRLAMFQFVGYAIGVAGMVSHFAPKPAPAGSVVFLKINQTLGREWSGRPGSNRRRPAWEAGILPLNYARLP